MNEQKCFDHYPYWIVFLANLFQISVSIIGALIMYKLGLIWLIFYLLYVCLLEIRLLKKSCINCYYYGKVCFSGKGKLCSLFFKKGDPEKFNKIQITFKDIVPDFLVSLLPVFAGSVLLVLHFEWLLLLLVISVLLLTFIGNGLIRGSLACKFCRQRTIGCPAEQLFNKANK